LKYGGGSAFQAPYSGGYNGGSFLDQGSNGSYWSSTPNGSYAYRMSFLSDGNLYTSGYHTRKDYYLAVRCYRQ
jgi:hypothetical protein